MKAGTLSFYMTEADVRDARRESPFFGITDPSVIGLRAFIAYHKDARENYEIAGKVRSLTHKQVAMYGLMSRLEVTGERTTMTAIAKEAHVVVSTVSRFLLKLQVWGAYTVDVTRGRNGGIVIRKALSRFNEYARQAWAKVRSMAEKALSRTKRNVASNIPRRDEGVNEAIEDNVVLPNVLDATFTEAWDAAERRGRLLAAELASQTTPTLAPAAGTFSPGRLTAANVIAERRWLDDNDPDWDLQLDIVRDSYGIEA